MSICLEDFTKNAKRNAVIAALLLTTGVTGCVGVPSYPQQGGVEPVTEPISLCDAGKIYKQIQTNTGTKAFGQDGCVYGVSGGRALALKNFNLHSEQGAAAFYSEVNQGVTYQPQNSTNAPTSQQHPATRQNDQDSRRQEQERRAQEARDTQERRAQEMKDAQCARMGINAAASLFRGGQLNLQYLGNQLGNAAYYCR